MSRLRAEKLGGAAAFVSAFAVAAAAAVTGPSASPPPGLTYSGRTLWQFEALLHDTFGTRPVCASGRWAQKFRSGVCKPLAVYSPYFYVFADAHRSAFHISSKKQVGGFGNYPVALSMRGHPVACDKREARFLIFYRDTSFTLGCMRAGYVTP